MDFTAKISNRNGLAPFGPEFEGQALGRSSRPERAPHTKESPRSAPDRLPHVGADSTAISDDSGTISDSDFAPAVAKPQSRYPDVYSKYCYERRPETFPQQSPEAVHRSNIQQASGQYATQSISGGASRFTAVNVFREATALCFGATKNAAGPVISARPELTPALTRNLEAGIQAARKVAQTIPRAANAFEAGRPYVEIKHDMGTRRWLKVVNHAEPEEINSMRQEIRLEKMKLEEPSLRDLTEITRHIAGKYGVGNCQEQAFAAYQYLIEDNVHNAELMSISIDRPGEQMLPHIMVVIGRTDGSLEGGSNQVGMPNTWSSSAVICDPWSHAAFPAHEYEAFYDRLIEFATQRDCELIFSLLH